MKKWVKKKCKQCGLVWEVDAENPPKILCPICQI